MHKWCLKIPDCIAHRGIVLRRFLGEVHRWFSGRTVTGGTRHLRVDRVDVKTIGKSGVPPLFRGVVILRRVRAMFTQLRVAAPGMEPDS